MLISYPFRFIISNMKRCLNRPSAPFLLNYSITLRCNLDCKYCGVSRLENNYAEEELTARDIAFFLRDKALKRLALIAVSGGEPFLKNDIEDILLEFQKRVSPYAFHITTNGFLTEKIVNSVKFMKTKGLNIELKVSIDDIADKHDTLRNKEGSFARAIETIQKLRGLFNAKKLFIGINHTIFEENYKSIPEVKKIADTFAVAYRGFIGLKKRPLYTGNMEKDYGLTNLSRQAKDYIKEKINSNHYPRAYINNRLRFIDDVIIGHYVKGQIRMLDDNSLPRHKCMCLFTHFRMNPNGDIITCSYDLDVLGNIKTESYSSILKKEGAKDKLKKIKKCGRCWLGCEVSPSWISSLFMS